MEQLGGSPHSPAWSLGGEGAGGEKGWGVGDRMVVSQPCFSKPGKSLQENPKRKQIGKDKGRIHLCRQITQGQVKGEGEGSTGFWNVWSTRLTLDSGRESGVSQVRRRETGEWDGNSQECHFLMLRGPWR